MLKYILLGFLSYGQLTGYDLKRLIDNSTVHFWNAYHSQIYTTLRKMEADGWVGSTQADDSDDKLNRRSYTLTQAGEAALTEWLAKPLTQLPGTKDELMVRVFFSARRDKNATLDELRHQRELHRQRLATYEGYRVERLLSDHANTNTDTDAAFWGMTLRHGMAYEKMYIAWLSDVIAEIEAI